MEKEIKDLEKKIAVLKVEIEHRKKNLLSDTLNSLLSKKCEYCGVPEGIHRSDCLFIKRYCT